MGANSVFMKNAFHALVERNVIPPDMLVDSTVTDEMINRLEEELEVTIPEEVRDYLKAYAHSMDMLRAAVPEDREDTDAMHQIKEMTGEEIDDLDEDDVPYLEAIWSDILPVPKENPLEGLKNAILGFREFADMTENDGVDEDAVKRFVPVGDWMSAGPLCLDTEMKKEDVDIDNPDTWQIRWFDHEAFDWESEEYIDETGKVVGRPLFPDFETFIRLYFYGVYDKQYEMQSEREGEERPDKSTWYR